MALTPGTRFGPYEIAAQIGAGGMGEVYRATDTNLKRSVTTKVLSEAVAGNAELWRAVDQDADVIDGLVQSRRDRRAAERFFARLLKGQVGEPRRLATDKLRS